VAASEVARRADQDTRQPHRMRHVAVVIAGVVAGYAVVASMVALAVLF
jgi:hypothetical protein